jgi:BASS family bile acid:Na+ symporter
VDQVINVLVMVMLIEMMVAIGLGVTFVELAGVARNWRLVGRAALANYLLVPAATVGLLIWFRPADPTVPAGFLILAVCPGAPFGPPCTAIAGGNVATSVGFMVFLAGSSVIAAPLLLTLLLPLMMENNSLPMDGIQIGVTLLVTQLIPLCAGLLLRFWQPGLAERLRKPANLLSVGLSLATVGLILVVQWDALTEIRFQGWIGMAVLLIVSCAFGWLLGGPGKDNRKAMTLTTALRNVGVGLVIATAAFANTAAVSAVVVYGLFEIAGSLLLALWWARQAPATATDLQTDDGFGQVSLP